MKEGKYFLHPSDKGTFQSAQLKCDLVARIPIKKITTARLSNLLGYSLYCLMNGHHKESLILSLCYSQHLMELS